MSAPLLQVDRLSVRFRTGGWLRPRVFHAAREVSFAVDRAQIVALVGESGSGKSTLARAIVRLAPVAGGALRWEGRDILTEEPRGASLDWRRKVQLVFQDPFASLNPVHPVGHAIARALLLHGHATAAEVDARVAAALASVGLEPAAELARRHPHALSGGQRQRAALAAALAVDPALLLADEPTSMLDVSLRADVLRQFARLRDQQGRSVLLVTHDLGSARVLADRAVVLYAGAVAEDGPAREVLARPVHPYARALVAASRRGALAQVAAADPGQAHLRGERPAGCAFAPRCPRASAACREAPPPVVALAPDRAVTCHHPEP